MNCIITQHLFLHILSFDVSLILLDKSWYDMEVPDWFFLP